ncbi:class I SAM-dependent methyltransferase [Salegentibacter sp. JZCK2]|uniref:N-6 DNA methylase n=1 Tax=Salegentibacter tibetensis TaxID=2873600 RepID=UPI001CCAFF7D|nr:class I SAM-dependent methyltransferase [Salegentibacter tibetensis]MBZ9730788.1 class I SAM-dependent methyltransferase [Salegentibacter tibetensis]
MAKEQPSKQKLRGGYYTPQPITDFLCRWCIDENSQHILEPSSGDGNFLSAAVRRLQELGVNSEEISNRLQGIELLSEEAVKASERLRDMRVDPVNIINTGDFFHFIANHPNQRYDAVIGNPPFIRYQNFPQEHRDVAIDMMKDLGLKPNKLTNIWVPFLVLSAHLLNDEGKMAMVIPAELFQVKYAAETRIFLSEIFERLTIISFKRLVFDHIQQEVILLLGERNVESQRGIRAIELDGLDDLENLNLEQLHQTPVKSIDHASEKWTKYFLEENEIQLLKELKQDPRVITCGDIMEVDVGLVTGRNAFFMLQKDQVDTWQLSKNTNPVVSRSNQLKGIRFSEEDFTEISGTQQSVHLFIPPNEALEKLSPAAQNYIHYGEKNDFHTGYKTRIRKRWYVTPSLWIPDGFALRQIHDYPKLILNETGASATDTIHRIRFKKNINGRLVSALFLNSLSFAFSEITGRSYGGGVMTFEPTEIEEIAIPQIADLPLDFEEIDQLIRKRRIEDVLDIVDEAFLIGYHGFSKDEVNRLRDIWRKLSQRRIQRKRRKPKANS